MSGYNPLERSLDEAKARIAELETALASAMSTGESACGRELKAVAEAARLREALEKARWRLNGSMPITALTEIEAALAPDHSVGATDMVEPQSTPVRVASVTPGTPMEYEVGTPASEPTCPHCGRMIDPPKESDHCSHCGFDFTPSEPKPAPAHHFPSAVPTVCAPQPAPSTPASEPNPAEPKCSSCGAAIERGRIYCKSCAPARTMLKPAPSGVRCVCGHGRDDHSRPLPNGCARCSCDGLRNFNAV